MSTDSNNSNNPNDPKTPPHSYIPPTQKLKRTRRKSATFPPQFLQLFLHVADTGESVFVNTLTPNSRGIYLSFRARLNEFRKSYDYEAKQGMQGRVQEFADKMYGVIVRDPIKDTQGNWGVWIEQKERGYGAALDQVLTETVNIYETGEEGGEEKRKETKDAKNTKSTKSAKHVEETDNLDDTSASEMIAKLYEKK